MTTGSEWTGRVGESWAALWRQTDRSFAPVTARLLDHPTTRRFAQALDIGCGAGEIACALAAANPSGGVVGIDLSADLVAVARSRCPGAVFVEGDACDFLPDDAPDLLISRHGVMFFADPVAAFARFREIAAPAATLRFSCFRPREENVWAMRLAGLVAGTAPASDSSAPGPFAFGDAGRVAAILCKAGWQEARFERLDYLMPVGEGDAACEEAVAYFRRIGPAARLLAELPQSQREDAMGALRGVVAEFHDGGRVALPASAWIVTARAPG